ncbi:MAG: RebB family R body protein [Aestuariibacter sp.]
MSNVYDAIALAQMSNLASPPYVSIGMAEITMAQSISGVMYNAVDTEKHSQTIQNTAAAQCCALMISAGAAGATK